MKNPGGQQSRGAIPSMALLNYITSSLTKKCRLQYLEDFTKRTAQEPGSIASPLSRQQKEKCSTGIFSWLD